MSEKNNDRIFENIFIGPAVIAVTTGISFFFKYINIPETNIAIIHLLAVVALSIFTQRYFTSLVYSILTTLTFNYFFTEPYMAFEIGSVSYAITFVVMVTVSLVITMLTQRIKKNAQIANKRAEENLKLYNITNEISAAQSVEDIMRMCARDISEICNVDIVCIYRNILVSATEYRQYRYIKGRQDKNFSLQIDGVKDFEKAAEEYKNNVQLRRWDAVGGDGTVMALFCVPRTQAGGMDDSRQRVLMISIESAAMAADRMIAAERQALLQNENEKERYRSNLLRAISHDLRTPLSGIMGTSEMIMGMTDRSDRRYELALEIMEDANWLHSLMENILNLTKLEDNQNHLNRQLEAVEEIIAVVLERFEKRSQGRELAVAIPDRLILVPVDAKLIVQVLINLLDNAVKHTTSSQKIYLTVEKQDTDVCFTVRDEGVGISAQDLPYIFQMYYTTARTSSDAQKGMGLGLAICDAVVKAHGGTITAGNHPEGGAVFTFTLPMEAGANEQ